MLFSELSNHQKILEKMITVLTSQLFLTLMIIIHVTKIMWHYTLSGIIMLKYIQIENSHLKLHITVFTVFLI